MYRRGRRGRGGLPWRSLRALCALCGKLPLFFVLHMDGSIRANSVCSYQSWQSLYPCSFAFADPPNPPHTLLQMRLQSQLLRSSRGSVIKAGLHLRIGRSDHRGRANASVHETIAAETLREFGKPARRPSPPQLLDVLEERRVGSQRRQRLEQKRELVPSAENGGRELLDGAVPVEQLRRGRRSDAWDARIAVGRIADEREIVGNLRWQNAEL